MKLLFRKQTRTIGLNINKKVLWSRDSPCFFPAFLFFDETFLLRLTRTARHGFPFRSYSTVVFAFWRGYVKGVEWLCVQFVNSNTRVILSQSTSTWQVLWQVTKFISRHKSVSPTIPFHRSFLENVNITLVFSVLALFKNCARSIVPSHRTQSTVYTYIHIKLLLIGLLAPSYYYHQIYKYYCFEEHHKYSTIITQYAQILLLSHKMLKYSYFYCTARQIHKDRRGRARRRTWWATICQGTGLWVVESYIQLCAVMGFRDFACINIHTFITHIYIHTCMYIYIYIYMYVCMYI